MEKIEELNTRSREEMLVEIKREIYKMNDVMRREMEGLAMEMSKNMKEEFKKRDSIWEEEKRELKNKIEEMSEVIMDLKKKENMRRCKESRKNVILTGTAINVKDKSEQNLKRQVNHIFQEKIGVQVKVKKVQYLTKNRREKPIIRVELKDESDKGVLMRSKARLKEQRQDLYIDDDLTKEDRLIQCQLRKYANDQRALGKLVKVGYRGVLMDGQWVYPGRNWTRKSEHRDKPELKAYLRITTEPEA